MTDNTVAKVMTGQNSNRAVIERRATTEDKINQIQASLIKLNLSGIECAARVCTFHTVVQHLVFQRLTVGGFKLFFLL